MVNSTEKSTANVHESLRRWRRLDDRKKLQMRVYRAMRVAEEIMYAENSSRSERLKAVTALQQTAQTYLKILGACEEKMSDTVGEEESNYFFQQINDAIRTNE